MHKTILITGASSGIGEATARRFAQAGSRLILNARNTEKLTSLKKELEESYGTEVYLIPFDVRDFQSAEKAIGSLPETFRQIDVLVNNAGLALGVDKEFEGDMTDYETMIDTNIKALLKITQLVVPGMIARHTGHVINIGSIAGEKAYPGGSVYCATKSCSQGSDRRIANGPLRYSHKGHQCEAWPGGDQFLRHPLPRRQTESRQGIQQRETFDRHRHCRSHLLRGSCPTSCPDIRNRDSCHPSGVSPNGLERIGLPY